jgi:hypothetical protein
MGSNFWRYRPRSLHCKPQKSFRSPAAPQGVHFGSRMGNPISGTLLTAFVISASASHFQGAFFGFERETTIRFIKAPGELRKRRRADMYKEESARYVPA